MDVSKMWFATVTTHWSEVVTAACLAWGDPTDLRRPRNLRIVKKLRGLTIALLTRGPAAASQYTNVWRADAMRTGNLRLMQASTLKRALWWVPSEELVRAKVEEAKERFHSDPKKLHPSTRKAIMGPFSNFLKRHIKKSEQAPLTTIPSRNACIERSRQKGGVRSVLMEACREELEVESLDPLGDLRSMRGTPAWTPNPYFDPSLTGEQKRDALLTMQGDRAFLAAQEAGLSYVECVEHKIAHMEELWSFYLKRRFNPVHGPPEITENVILEYCLLQQSLHPCPPVKLIGLPEKGNKVRVASLHPAWEVHVGRCLMHRSIQNLRRLAVTKDSLRGKTPRIIGSAGAQAYSADLTAASDNMTHETAGLLWQSWCKALGERRSVTAAGLNLLSAKSLDGTRTTSGVHMGLGLSWLTLCLANCYAAWRANAKPAQYRICGDDLIGAFTPQQKQDFERGIRELNLIPNLSKSYYQNHGVFCERLVKLDVEPTTSVRSPPEPPGSNRTRRPIWRAPPMLQISDVALSKAKAMGGEISLQHLLTFHQVQPPKGPMSRLRDVTLARVPILKKAGTGPIHLGGNGRLGALRPAAVARALKSGPISGMRGAGTRPLLTRSRQRTGTEQVSLQQATSWLQRHDCFKNDDWERPEVSEKTLRYKFLSRAKGKEMSNSSFKQTILSSTRITSAVKRKVRFLMRKGAHPKGKKVLSVLRQGLSNGVTEYVDLLEIEDVKPNCRQDGAFETDD
jgi:hypothetical protein